MSPAAHEWEFRRWTPLFVKLYLPPRQSRGASLCRLALVQHELSTIRQRFGCRGHACVEQELSGILVAGTHRLLRQRLDRRARTNVSGWRACFWLAQTPSVFKGPGSRTRNRRRGTQIKTVAHAHDTLVAPLPYFIKHPQSQISVNDFACAAMPLVCLPRTLQMVRRSAPACALQLQNRGFHKDGLPLRCFPGR